jgi:nuclear transport factor 2 (NTF2) superfamily protein
LAGLQDQPLQILSVLLADEGQRMAREFPYNWSRDGQWIVSAGERYVPGQSAIALLPLFAAPAAERRARVVTSDAWNAMAGHALSG